MDILDLLDEEADRIQYDTMMPTSEQRRGAENFYSDSDLQRTLENKVDSHFVVANVNLSESEYESEGDSELGIAEIVYAINEMSTKLNSAISNINLNFGEHFEKEYASQAESTRYLEKLFFLERDELKRQERERLMAVKRDLNPSDLTTSSSVSVGTNPFADKPGTSGSDDGLGFLPNFGGNDKDKDKDKNRPKKKGWFSRAVSTVKKIPFSKKDIAKYALGAAAIGGTAYAMSGDDDESEVAKPATPAQSNNTRKDPWNYWPNGSPKTDISNLKPNQRKAIEAKRKRAWENGGRANPSVTTSDPDTKPIEQGTYNASPSATPDANSGMSFSDMAITALTLSSMPGIIRTAGNFMPDVSNLWSPNRPPTPTNMPTVPPSAAPVNSGKFGALKSGFNTIKESSLAKGASKFAGRANVLANVAMGGAEAYDIYNDEEMSTRDKTVQLSGVGGSIAGGVAGGALGASIGSVVPVVGTIIGGIAGSALGSYLGEEGMEAVSDSIYSWFDDDENTEEIETETKAASDSGLTKADISAEPAEEIITRINSGHAKKEKALSEANAEGKDFAVVDNTKVTRDTSGNIKSDPISRTLSNAKNKAEMERRLFVGKLKPSLMNYASDNGIDERHVDNVLKAYSNPMMTFGDATVIARDLLSDPKFDPNVIISGFKQPRVVDVSTNTTSPLALEAVAQSGYPVNSNMESEVGRENFVEVREVRTESQYDKAAEVAKSAAPKPTINKRKNEKPKTVIKSVQAPLSLNLIDNLENQAGLNYLGSTF